METLILEDDDPATALLRYASDSQINSLVLGSCSSNYITRWVCCHYFSSSVPALFDKQSPFVKTCVLMTKRSKCFISVSNCAK